MTAMKGQASKGLSRSMGKPEAVIRTAASTDLTRWGHVRLTLLERGRGFA